MVKKAVKFGDRPEAKKYLILLQTRIKWFGYQGRIQRL